MGAHLLSVTSRSVDSHAIGTQMVQRYSEFSRRSLQFRKDHPNVPIVDVLFDDMVASPVATACGVMGQLGMPCSESDRGDMQELMESSFKRHKHGKHRYDLKDFGLTEGGLKAAFAGEVELMNSIHSVAEDM